MDGQWRRTIFGRSRHWVGTRHARSSNGDCALLSKVSICYVTCLSEPFSLNFSLRQYNFVHATLFYAALPGQGWMPHRSQFVPSLNCSWPPCLTCSPIAIPHDVTFDIWIHVQKMHFPLVHMSRLHMCCIMILHRRPVFCKKVNPLYLDIDVSILCFINVFLESS